MSITKIITIVATIILLFSTASAASLDEYNIVYAKNSHIEQGLDVLFGDKASEVKNQEFRSNMHDFFLIDDFYGIENNNENLSLSYHVLKKHPYQSSLYINYNKSPIKDPLIYNGAENVEPSGEAKGDMSRENAIKQARSMIEKLGFTDYRFVSAIAYGASIVPKGKGYPEIIPYYEILFRQEIAGLPLYLSAPFFEEGGNSPYSAPSWVMSSHDIKITLTSQDLYTIESSFSDAIPLNKASEIISEDRAREIFLEHKFDTEELELCYLACPSVNDVVALPAYRYKNHFIHAVSGEWLQ